MAGRPRKRPETITDKSTRETILDIAERLCAEQGPEAVKLRQIARDVGIEAPSMFSHFKNRDAIMTTLFESGMKDLRHCYSQLAGDDPRQQLQQLIELHTGVFRKRPAIMRLLLLDLAKPGGETAIENNLPLVQEINKLEQQILDEGVRQNIFRPVEAQTAILMRITMIASLLAAAELVTVETDPAASVSDNMLRYLAV